MFNIKKICENLTDSIASQLDVERDEKAVIQYGLFAIIQTSITILLNIILGIMFGVVGPTLVISLIAVWLRKYSGGAHSETSEGCAIIGTIVAVGGALIVSSVSWKAGSIAAIGAIVFVLAFFIIYKLAPVDCIAKPIKKLEKRKMLRRKSIFILSVYFIFCLSGLFLYFRDYNEKWLLYIACSYVGILWQSFTLTTTGHLTLAKIDYLFNKISKR